MTDRVTSRDLVGGTLTFHDGSHWLVTEAMHTHPPDEMWHDRLPQLTLRITELREPPAVPDDTPSPLPDDTPRFAQISRRPDSPGQAGPVTSREHTPGARLARIRADLAAAADGCEEIARALEHTPSKATPTVDGLNAMTLRSAARMARHAAEELTL